MDSTYDLDLDTSITVLRSVAQTNDKTKEDNLKENKKIKHNSVTNSELFTDKHTSSDTDIQCTDDCTIKANAQFVCGNICMEWYHPFCVGINYIDDVGAWVCARRRLLPKTIDQLKSQMTTLLGSTHKTITCISELTEKRKINLKISIIA